MRTYDKRVKNQPISEQTDFNKVPIKNINRMIHLDNENHLCIGESTGRCCILEKRMSKYYFLYFIFLIFLEYVAIKTVCKAQGAITDICYLGDNFISTVSKDRYLRLYDNKLYEETAKIYLKNQLTSMTIIEEKVEEVKENKDLDLAESEEDNNEENDDSMEEDEDSDSIVDINWDNIEYDQSDDDEPEEDDYESEMNDFLKKKKLKESKNKKRNGQTDDDDFIVIGQENKKDTKKSSKVKKLSNKKRNK